jgi:hypothetical protein
MKLMVCETRARNCRQTIPESEVQANARLVAGYVTLTFSDWWRTLSAKGNALVVC